jgi:hypothetical protein
MIRIPKKAKDADRNIAHVEWAVCPALIVTIIVIRRLRKWITAETGKGFQT